MNMSDISETTTMIIVLGLGVKSCWQFAIGSIRDVLKGWLNTCPEIIIDLRTDRRIFVYLGKAD